MADWVEKEKDQRGQVGSPLSIIVRLTRTSSFVSVRGRRRTELGQKGR